MGIVTRTLMSPVRSAARFTVKQGALMGLLFCLPGMWFSYSGLDEDSMMDPFAYGTVQVMVSLGFALFVAGMAYRALPFDLIPDFLPVVGGLDDMVAGMIAGAGVALMYLGWQFGTGPKPIEMIIVAEIISQLRHLFRPLTRVALFAARAGVAAAKPLAAAAMPHVRVATEAAKAAAWKMVDKVAGQAVEQYLGKLVAENPAMSLVRKFTK